MKVSVVTVCLNAAPYIRRTLESVLAQDHPDLEYIVVDGGSTDGTVEIIREFAGDPRLRWSTGPDRGIADAMNKGADRATGELLAYLNADDYYAHPEVLSHVVSCFREHPESLWLTGGMDFVAADDRRVLSVRVRRYSFRRLVRGNIILHPSTFVRTDAFRKAGGFDPSLRYCMDYALFLRVGACAAPFLLDEQLSCFRVHAGSRTLAEAKQSYAEELQVRIRFLHERGRATLFYRLDYQLKKHLNFSFYRRLSSPGRPSGR